MYTILYIDIRYPILNILQSNGNGGGVISYNSMKGGMDLKRLRTLEIKYNA